MMLPLASTTYFQSEMFYRAEIFCLEIAALYANGKHAARKRQRLEKKYTRHSGVIFEAATFLAQ
jgi:hypothetical protein